jgi:hypothetical protein
MQFLMLFFQSPVPFLFLERLNYTNWMTKTHIVYVDIDEKWYPSTRRFFFSQACIVLCKRTPYRIGQFATQTKIADGCMAASTNL